MPTYQLKDGVLTATLPNGCQIRQDKHPQTNDPITEENARAVLEACVPADQWRAILKFEGISFGGVMCSATKEDMWGLNSLYASYQMAGQAFQPTRFDFANGSALVITKNNIQEFMAVWVPFRQGFFAAN